MSYRTVSRKPRTFSRETEEQKQKKYTLPRKRYQYSTITWNEYMSNKYDGLDTVRSSFIPYVIDGGKKYWILGSFHDYPNDILTDFGGSCKLFDPPRQFLKRGEQQHINFQHQFGCAMLEVNEESKGLLSQPILKSLGTNNTKDFKIYKGVHRRDREKLYFFFISLELDEMVNTVDSINKSPSITKEKFGPVDFYEESDILERKFRTSRNLTDFLDYLTNRIWVFRE